MRIFTWDIVLRELSLAIKIIEVTDIKKVTSGSTPSAANLVDSLYARSSPPVHTRRQAFVLRKPQKSLENAQRDLNVALINEFAMIFNRLGIDTEAVLGGRRNEVEFSAVSAWIGGRALHRS